MKGTNLFFIVCIIIATRLHAQPKIDPATQAQITQNYRLGLQYKDGHGVAMDYTKAVGYFQQAASLGDAQSIYALAYMQYKGLGCTQDYASAASLFAQGAFQGRDNSMYFYALCWRNGYGLAKNEDSALYWLKKDSAIGYRQAIKELAMKQGENSNDSAKALVLQISNAAIPNSAAINKFQEIGNRLPAAGLVAGNYAGWLIQYDWSGQNVISSKPLRLALAQDGGILRCGWTEGNLDSIGLQATVKNDSVVFNDTKYKRKDHYSPDSGITYQFKNARLNMVQKDDTVFLAGNVVMFSPLRGEPSKPLFVALSRVDKQNPGVDIGLRASPNPFTNILNVEFTIPKDATVEVQLLSPGGEIVYRNPAGALGAGHYLLPLQPGFIAPGVYVVKLVYGSSSAVVKVVKQ